MLCSAATLVCATPALDVKVTTTSGIVVYRGNTDADGMFTTKSLTPGSYVVQFNAKEPIAGKSLALIVHAGKTESSADSVPASKFSKGGVAMRIEVSSATPLTGQVAPAGTKMASTSASTSSSSKKEEISTSGSGTKKSKLKTKMVDGKEYVWIGGGDDMGSSFGGHWVPADSPEGKVAIANQH
jgi:hypothetical protein